MAEIRQDAITGRSVIIAPGRARRPGAFPSGASQSSPAASSADECPFCRGFEDHTPPEVLVLPKSAGRDWKVRVVPNKYPALAVPPAVSNSATTVAQIDDPLYRVAPAIGAHEVIVEDPRHITTTGDTTAENMSGVFRAYRDRFNYWKQDDRLVWPIAFKNLGEASGASLEHLHSQLMVLPIVPPDAKDKLFCSQRYFDRHHRCPFCEMLDRERAESVRTIIDDAQFTVFCPYASRVPFETWIVPRQHASHFETTNEDVLAQLGVVVLRTLRAIERLPAEPCYNLILHTAPFDIPAGEHYHWHIEVLPHQVKTAGFERGSGMGLNPVPPEQAATILRNHCE